MNIVKRLELLVGIVLEAQYLVSFDNLLHREAWTEAWTCEDKHYIISPLLLTC